MALPKYPQINQILRNKLNVFGEKILNEDFTPKSWLGIVLHLPFSGFLPEAFV